MSEVLQMDYTSDITIDSPDFGPIVEDINRQPGIEFVEWQDEENLIFLADVSGAVLEEFQAEGSVEVLTLYGTIRAESY